MITKRVISCFSKARDPIDIREIIKNSSSLHERINKDMSNMMAVILQENATSTSKINMVCIFFISKTFSFDSLK